MTTRQRKLGNHLRTLTSRACFRFQSTRVRAFTAPVHATPPTHPATIRLTVIVGGVLRRNRGSQHRTKLSLQLPRLSDEYLPFAMRSPSRFAGPNRDA